MVRVVKITKKIRVFAALILASFLLLGLLDCSGSQISRAEEARALIAESQARCFTNDEVRSLRSVADGDASVGSSEEIRQLVVQAVYLLGNHLSQSQREVIQECTLDSIGYSSQCEVAFAEVINQAINDGHACEQPRADTPSTTTDGRTSSPATRGDVSPPPAVEPPPQPTVPTAMLASDGTIRAVTSDGTIIETAIDHSTETTTSDGIRITTRLDGSREVSLADGTTTVIAPDGSTRTVTPSGTTITSQPDGTTIASDGSIAVTEPDGTSRTTTSDGVMLVTAPDGTTTVTTPDGTSTTANPDGSSTTSGLDGVVVTTNSDGTRTAMTSDGTRVFTATDRTTTVTAPDGTVTVVEPGGTITETAPDGTVTETAPHGTETADAPDGSTTATAPDGTVEVTAPDGTNTRPDGRDGTVSAPDEIPVTTRPGPDPLVPPVSPPGEDTITTTSPDGTVSVTAPDGTTTVTAPDGTETITTPGGTITTTSPDGTVEVATPDGVTTQVAPDGTVTTFPPSITTFDPANRPGGGFVPALSPTPPSEPAIPGGDPVITSPAGNVPIPSSPTERRDVLTNLYTATESVSIPDRPTPTNPVSPETAPDVLDTEDFSETSDFLLDPNIRLTSEETLPYYAASEPATFENETNSYDDPAFDGLRPWQKDYWFARFHSGANGHILYLLDYTYGTRRRAADGDSPLYIKQDELYIGWPYRSSYRLYSALNMDDLVDPTRLHLPLRKAHTVRITDPMPGLTPSASVAACSNVVTGLGTKADPFKIYNFQQLDDYLRRYITAYFEIECDIDASSSLSQNGGMGFAPIRYFAGFVNGKGHKITNLYINRPGEHQVGLFAQLLGSKIENLTIENARVFGKYQVGILAGHMVRSLVDSVKVTGRVQGVGETGGLIGFQTSHFFAYTRGIVYEKTGIMKLFIPYRTAEVKNSHARVLVNCVRGTTQDKYFHRMCGGLVGWMGSGFINSSSSSGNLVMSEAPVGDGSSVTIDGDMAGGIVGVIGTRTNDGGVTLIESDGPFGGADVFQQARVYRSFSTMNLYGGLSIGGLVGLALRGGVVIAESYTEDVRIEGHAMLAGLVAVLEGSYVVNCHVTDNKIYTHYDDGGTGSIDLPTSPSVYSFIGYSDSIFTDDSEKDLAVLYHRTYARYLASSRFKIGVQNTYADSQTYFFLGGSRNGRMKSFVNNITGSYYRLDGTAGFVVETALDNYVVQKFALNEGTGTGYGILSYDAFYPPYENIADLWNHVDFSEVSDALPGWAGIYGWRINNVDSRHLRTRKENQLTCPTAPGANCNSASGTFSGWSADIWNFRSSSELPVIRNAAPDPGLN